MSLPFKKRKMNVPLAVKVNRLAKAVSRQKPDLQQATISSVCTNSVVGYNEFLIDCYPSDLMQNTEGNFIIEKVEARAYVTSATGQKLMTIDIFNSRDGQIPSTGGNYPQQFDPQKSFKTYAHSYISGNDASPNRYVQISARPRLVVRRNGGGSAVNNQVYVMVRTDCSAINGSIKVEVSVYFREK